MRSRTAVFMCLGLAVLAGSTSITTGSGSPDSGKKVGHRSGPIVQVKTALLREGTLDETIRVYGYVIPAPGALNTISVPFEIRVSRIMVNQGQEVQSGDVLLQIEPSPNTQLKYRQAQDTYNTAKQALENVERRFKLKLVTNEQVLQAQQTFEQAQLNLRSMKEQGIGAPIELRAKEMGLVDKVSVDQGAIVAPGAPLMQIVPENRLELRLGVEPEDINKVHIGMPVSLSRVLIPAAPVVVGKVRKISRAVDPSTRLVNVFVSVPSPQVFLIGQYVAGRITVASVKGLMVPRSAVLPEKRESVLYIVKDGRAVRKAVRTLAEDENDAVVEGEGLEPGDPVVVMGNYELQDNMQVAVEATP